MSRLTRSLKSLIRRFSLGIALGAVLGFLTAPQRGRKTRQALNETTQTLGEATSKIGQALRSRWALLQERLETVDREEVRARQKEIMREAQAASRMLRQRAEEARQRMRLQAEAARRRLEEVETRPIPPAAGTLAEERRRGGRLPGSLILGGIVGAALGLLYAPRQGSQTREKLLTTSRQLREKAAPATARASVLVKEAAEASRPVIHETRQRLVQGVELAKENVRPKVEQARQNLGPKIEQAGQRVRRRLKEADESTAGVSQDGS